MEEHAHLVGVGATRADLGALSRQDCPNAACYMGGLDSTRCSHLFGSARPTVSAFQSRANFLGIVADLHDKSFRGKNRSGRTAGAFCGSTADIMRFARRVGRP